MEDDGYSRGHSQISLVRLGCATALEGIDREGGSSMGNENLPENELGFAGTFAACSF